MLLKEVIMSPQLLRVLIAGALFVHGVGHTLGFFMPARSWLLPGAGEPVLRIVGGIIWALATVGFIAAFLGFIGFLVPAEWWRPLAIAFAVVSLLGLFLFWGTWAAFNTIGALGMNIAILVLLLWVKWPPVSLFGR
jgi:hypothetical protein